tara:strand:- start:6331 stop:6567 length:237 start_codon:yes stop_codon:yes gene_type:complete
MNFSEIKGYLILSGVGAVIGSISYLLPLVGVHARKTIGITDKSDISFNSKTLLKWTMIGFAIPSLIILGVMWSQVDLV